jgi:Regulator of ribonuclease activity B
VEAAMIALEQLELMFSNVRAKTPWRVDGPMLWGYFFFDPSEARLRPLRDRLVGEGYRFVDLGPTDEGHLYRLHVERVEIHSPQSLYERNAVLEELADEFEVERYDGMDVGPVAS